MKQDLNLKFPNSNSLTAIDQKYFKMIQSEADWGNYTLDTTKVSELRANNKRYIYRTSNIILSGRGASLVGSTTKKGED